jgi:hypothetical protein
VHGTDVGGVGGGAGEVDHPGPAHPREQDRVQPRPHARRVPLVQPVPQRHAAAAHLVGEVFPGDAALQDEQDPGEAHAAVDPRVPAERARLMLGQQGFDERPQVVRDQQLGHGVLRDEHARDVDAPRRTPGTVNLEALSHRARLTHACARDSSELIVFLGKTREKIFAKAGFS